MDNVESYSIVSNRRRIVEAKLQRERELRQELDELGVQNERKLLSIRRDRHQFIERYYYLCEKADLISKRCTERRNSDAFITDRCAIPVAVRDDKTADEPEVKTRPVVCCGSTNLPPLWLSSVKDVAATVDCFTGNADEANNQAKRTPRSRFIGTTTREGILLLGTTLPPVRNGGKREHYKTTVSNDEVRINRFPPIGYSDRDQAPAGRNKGRFRPLVKVLVGLLKKNDIPTRPECRRRSREKVLLTMDELRTCRYLRMPNDISPWATYSPPSPTIGRFR